jgi:autotransporter-associated beta strand protein
VLGNDVVDGRFELGGNITFAKPITLHGRSNNTAGGTSYDNSMNTAILNFSGNNTINSSITLADADLGTGNNFNFGSTSGKLTVTSELALPANALLAFQGAGNGEFTGAVSGDGGLRKLGSGDLTMSGGATDTYSGPTIIDGGKLVVAAGSSHTGSGGYAVNSGKLVVDGTIASAVTVNAGGTLSGSGTISGPVTLAGGMFSPGDPMTTTVGGLNIGNDSDFSFVLNAADTTPGAGSNDLIAIDGLLNISGTDLSSLSIEITRDGGGDFDVANTWTLMSYTSFSADLGFDLHDIQVTGYDASLFVPSLSVTNELGSGALQLTLTAVPEPGAIALLGIGLMGLGCCRRRKLPDA